MYCGADKISWAKFSAEVGLFVEFESSMHRVSDVIRRNPRYNHVPGWFDHVPEMGASILTDATGHFFRTHDVELMYEEWSSQAESDKESDNQSIVPLGTMVADQDQAVRRQRLLSLEYLVSTLTVFDTSIPHDSIYALLSLARDTEPISSSLVIDDSHLVLLVPSSRVSAKKTV
jgi:hypothetical protein